MLMYLQIWEIVFFEINSLRCKYIKIRPTIAMNGGTVVIK